MTARERMIELITDSPVVMPPETAEVLADHLLASGAVSVDPYLTLREGEHGFPMVDLGFRKKHHEVTEMNKEVE